MRKCNYQNKKQGRNDQCLCGSGKKYKKCCLTSSGLSLCMIVRNEEKNLGQCLESVANYTDEIIIVDTGSTDSTLKIASKYTDKIFEFKWVDDFSKARNFSLEKATKEWILVLDADELISEKDLSYIKHNLLSNHHAFAYELHKRSYCNDPLIGHFVPNDYKYKESGDWLGWQVEKNDLLFRNDPRIYYEDRIHETIRKSCWRSKLSIATTNIPVHHYGRHDMAEKAPIYLEQARKRYEENPEDYHNAYTLAAHIDWFASKPEDYEEAIDLLEFCYRKSKADIKVTHALGLIYSKTGNVLKSIEYSKKTIELDPNIYLNAWTTLLYGYFNTGQYTLLFDTYNQGKRINPSNFLLDGVMAEIHILQKNYWLAKNLLKPIVDKNPNWDKGKELLNRIDKEFVKTP